MMLPSDQDSTGRTLGAAELAYLMEAVNSGTLSTTKGKFGKLLETEICRGAGRKIRLRLYIRFGGDSHRGCGR